MYLSESSPTDADELRYIDAVRAKRELRSEIYRVKFKAQTNPRAVDGSGTERLFVVPPPQS